MPAVKKKIVWLAHEANMSGANIALLEYVDALNEVYDFHIILPHEGNMREALQQKGIPCAVIHQYGWAGKPGWWNWVKWFRIAVRSWIAIRETKQLIRKEKADLVFTNTLVPFVAAIAAHRLNKPHVWWIHEFGEEDFGFKTGWGNQKWSLRLMQKASKLIICNSFAVARKFQRLMPAATIQALYQPVSWNGKQVSVQEKKSRFLMFGQITPSKGHFEVLDTIIKLKGKQPASRLSLQIKGPCENKAYLDELFKYIKKYELQEFVKLETGFFKKEDVIPFYDLLILASKSEAFGRVIVEANKAGVRVIVRNSGGAPELINETNGILYNDREELVKILSGEKPMPVGIIRQNYDEKKEIFKLKNWLSAL